MQTSTSFMLPDVNIYLEGHGDELLNPSNYSPEINFYLYEEQHLFSKLVKDYDIIVEAGCISGTYAQLAITSGKEYIGIDIAAKYIEHAIEGDSDKLKFVCSDFCEFISGGIEVSTNKVLVMFPFNSLGNMKQTSVVFDALARYNYDFIISTYNNMVITQDIRKEYYNNAGFHDLTCISNNEGVRFINDTGLNSIAHSPSWLTETARHFDLEIRAIQLGNIGVAYTNTLH